MAAARKNLLVDLGTTFSLPVLYRDSEQNPVDLTGHDIRFYVTKPGHTDEVLAAAWVEGDDTGEFTVTFTDEDTATWTWKKGAYTLDIYEPSGNVVGLLFGTLTVRDRADVS